MYPNTTVIMFADRRNATDLSLTLVVIIFSSVKLRILQKMQMRITIFAKFRIIFTRNEMNCKKYMYPFMVTKHL